MPARGRRAHRHHGGQRPPAALPGPAPRRRCAVTGGRRQPLAGADHPTRRLPGTGTRGWRPCWPRTSCRGPTGAASWNAARRPGRGGRTWRATSPDSSGASGPGLRPFIQVNGAPAVALADGGSLRGVLLLHTDGQRLTALDWVVSPEKLASSSASRHRSEACPVEVGEERRTTHDDHAGHRRHRHARRPDCHPPARGHCVRAPAGAAATT